MIKLAVKIEFDTDSTKYTKEQLTQKINELLTSCCDVPVTVMSINYKKVKKERDCWKLACEVSAKSKEKALELFNKAKEIR